VVALGQQHNVTRRQRFGQNARFLAVTQHMGIGGEQTLERRRGLFGAEFLPKGEGAVDDIDHPDGNAQLRHLRHKGGNAAHP
jgi:hypothetical protein